MKKWIYCAGIALSFIACQHPDSETASNNNGQSAGTAEEKIVPEANTTDLDFDAAIAAFRHQDYETASRYISIAIQDLKKEADLPDNGLQMELDQTVAGLQTLADNIKKGEVTREEDLRAFCAQADMLTAHHYMMRSQAYPMHVSTVSSYQQALNRVERAGRKVTGKEQMECNNMAASMREHLSAGDIKANELGNKAGEKVHQMMMWLKVHAEKMGIKPPPQSDEI